MEKTTENTNQKHGKHTINTNNADMEAQIVPAKMVRFKSPTGIIQQSRQIETRFRMNKYFGRPTRLPYNITRGGDPRILIAAPHSTSQMRDDKVKKADIFTGTLGQLIAHATNSTVIYKTYNGGPKDRVNHHWYREALENLIAKDQPTILLDLHGMRDYGDCAIDLGNLHGASVDPWTTGLIVSTLERELNSVIKQNYRFSGGHEDASIGYLQNNTNIPSIQIEIAAKYRNIYLEENMWNYLDLLASLIILVEELKKIDVITRGYR